MIKKILRYVSRYVDYRMGILGAFVMAVVVFSINYFGDHSTAKYNENLMFWSFIAALKQGTYTFFFGGMINSVCP